MGSEESHLDRKKRERQAYLRRQDELENQPRDDEERRAAEAEDKHLADNFGGILEIVARMDDKAFDNYAKKNRHQVRRAGGKDKLAKARAKKQGGFCSLVLVGLLAAASATGWGLVEAVSAVTG